MLLAKEGEHLRNRIDEQLVLTTEKNFTPLMQQRI